MIDRSRIHPFLRPAWLVLTGVVAPLPLILALVLDRTPGFWAWATVALAALIPLSVLATVGVLRFGCVWKYFTERISCSCPKCPFHGIPYFRCPCCSRLLTDLRPTVYGVLHARCGGCGATLPTLDRLGRMDLPKVCPGCSGDLPHEALGKEPEFRIAIVGATSVGKSNLMIAALWQLLNQFAPNNDFEVSFGDPGAEAVYNAHVERLEKGQVMHKTGTLPFPTACGVSIRSPNGRSCLLYLYDAAGEDYEDETRLEKHPVEKYDGILFVLDPFAEEGVRRGLLGAFSPADLQQARPATVAASEILGRMMTVLERLLKESVGSQFPLPLAVAVTKIDACGLAQRLGLTRDPMGSFHLSSAAAAHSAEGYAARVREFLVHMGQGNFVRIVESRFARVSYFPVSALGRSPKAGGGTQFKPFGPLAPLLWLCHHMDALSDSDSVERAFVNFNLRLLRSLRGLEGGWARAGSWLALISLPIIVGLAAGLMPPLLFWLMGGIQLLALSVMYACLCYQLVRRRFRR